MIPTPPLHVTGICKRLCIIKQWSYTNKKFYVLQQKQGLWCFGEMSEEENHYISIIYYKLIDIIHINSGCIEEFRQNLTDHVFTINKRGIKYCRDREKNNKISSMEISKRFFASFCTPILLHRAKKRKRCYLQKTTSWFSPFYQMRSSIEMANVTLIKTCNRILWFE